MSAQKISKQRLLYILEKHSARVDMLPAGQREFVTMFLNIRKFNMLARNAGVNEVTVARRLRKIVSRINSDNFLGALSQDDLSEGKIEIIRGHFVNGLSVKSIAEKTGISRYRIRKTIQQMRKL
jgi:DNA invertase Pin-like site-specific DNA recombinase